MEGPPSRTRHPNESGGLPHGCVVQGVGTACARSQPLRGHSRLSRAAAFHVFKKIRPQLASWVTEWPLGEDTETWDQGQGGLCTAGGRRGAQRQNKPHSPRHLAPRRWGPLSPQTGCSLGSTLISEVLQKATGIHIAGEPRLFMGGVK